MSAFNRFGAVFSGVVSLYPGTTATDYGGQVTIEEAIDAACDKILAALPMAIHDQVVSPDLILAVQRATAGQTTFTLPILPIISPTIRIWTGQPSQFQDRPVTNPAQWPDDGGNVEIDSSAFSANYSNGLVTLSAALNKNDQVYASYDADVNAAAFSMPSLARMALRGAASELGSRLYSEANQEWLLVEKYALSFKESLDALSAGSWIPEETRFLKWWSEPEKNTGNGVQSVPIYRG